MRIVVVVLLLVCSTIVFAENGLAVDENGDRIFTGIESIDLSSPIYSGILGEEALIPASFESWLPGGVSTGSLFDYVPDSGDPDLWKFEYLVKFSADSDFLLLKSLGVFVKADMTVGVAEPKEPLPFGMVFSILMMESRLTVGPSIYFFNQGIKGMYIRPGVSTAFGMSVAKLNDIHSEPEYTMSVGGSIAVGYNFVLGNYKYGFSITPEITVQYDYLFDHPEPHKLRIPWGIKIGFVH